ncbi:hypothetical protein MNBD_GAMMA08-105 [hydrothermal vent metagenome]|uniref:Protein N-terminal glutamine amidohydrolase n=1 Tax=hydrothermal vent metagenome TaxID=652676 RepID=A0A3B0X5I9_9ZZZZ
MQKSDSTSYIYTRLFCEENIWKLVELLYMNKIAKPIDVLFLLNETNSIALYNQNQAESNTPVIWDYHVILCAEQEGEIIIYDFDSHCGFPTNITDYFNSTFPSHSKLFETYQPLIKLICADYFFKHFFSDRHHMIGLIDENEFPKYEIITPIKSLEKLTLDQCRNTQHFISNKKMMQPSEYLNSITKT